MLSGLPDWRGLARCGAAALALSACGGGGGGGAGGSPAPSSTQAQLDVAKRADAATGALRGIEAPLMLASVATDAVRKLARSGLRQVTETCPDDSGTVVYTLVDADGNGLPSAGDRVDVVYTNCSTALDVLLGSRIGGTLSVKLSVVSNALAGSVAGELSLGNQFGERIGGDFARRAMQGSLAFERSNLLLEDRIAVRSTVADDLRYVVTTRSGSTDVERTDAYSRIALTRSVQRDAARVSVTGALRNASDGLAGWVDVAIAPGLEADLEAFPDKGRVEIKGGGQSRVSVSVSSASGGMTGSVGIDADGDGREESATEIAWTDLSLGHLSSIRLGARYARLPDSPYVELLEAPFNYATAQDPAAPILLQFNHPVTLPSVVYARLRESNNELLAFQNGTDATLIDAIGPNDLVDIEAHGALLVLRPRRALHHGGEYSLVLSSSSDPRNPVPISIAGPAGTLPLELRGSIGFVCWDERWIGVTGASTRSLLMPGRAVSLGAVAPKAQPLPLKYTWTQVSGPAVTFGSASEATTTVALAGAIPTGIDRVLLTVTVTDALGRSGSRPVELQVANTDGLKTVLYLASERGEFIGAGRQYLFTESMGRVSSFTNFGYPSVRLDGNEGFPFWSLYVAGPGRSNPALGSYLGASSSALTTEMKPYLSFGGDGRGCESTGRFDILELVPDAQNLHYERLAIDFEQRCTGTTGVLRGSLRVGSDIPITP